VNYRALVLGAALVLLGTITGYGLAVELPLGQLALTDGMGLVLVGVVALGAWPGD